MTAVRDDLLVLHEERQLLEMKRMAMRTKSFAIPCHVMCNSKKCSLLLSDLRPQCVNLRLERRQVRQYILPAFMFGHCDILPWLTLWNVLQRRHWRSLCIIGARTTRPSQLNAASLTSITRTPYSSPKMGTIKTRSLVTSSGRWRRWCLVDAWRCTSMPNRRR